MSGLSGELENWIFKVIFESEKNFLRVLCRLAVVKLVERVLPDVSTQSCGRCGFLSVCGGPPLSDDYWFVDQNLDVTRTPLTMQDTMEI